MWSENMIYLIQASTNSNGFRSGQPSVWWYARPDRSWYRTDRLVNIEYRVQRHWWDRDSDLKPEIGPIYWASGFSISEANRPENYVGYPIERNLMWIWLMKSWNAQFCYNFHLLRNLHVVKNSNTDRAGIRSVRTGSDPWTDTEPEVIRSTTELSFLTSVRSFKAVRNDIIGTEQSSELTDVESGFLYARTEPIGKMVPSTEPNRLSTVKFQM